MSKHTCENCKHWVKGDLTPIDNQIGNLGTCVFMMQKMEGFYDKPVHVPYWAWHLSVQTISWNGEYCPVFKDKS